MIKSSISTGIFMSGSLGTKRSISLDKMVKQLKGFGYDGIELLPYDPQKVDTSQIKEVLSGNPKICAIATGAISFHYKVTMLDPEERNRLKCINLIEKYIDLAYKFEAPLVVIGSAIGKTKTSLARKKDIELLVNSLQKLDKIAQNLGIILAIEPINRYERNFLNSVNDGLRLLELLNSGNIRLLIDTFHMNIEESSMVNSIKKAGKEIVHVHIADSNRWPPGYGHINFQDVFLALREIGYKGYMSIECLPKPNLRSAITHSLKYLNSIKY